MTVNQSIKTLVKRHKSRANRRRALSYSYRDLWEAAVTPGSIIHGIVWRTCVVHKHKADQWRRKQLESGGAENAGVKRRPKNFDVPLHFSVVPIQVRWHGTTENRHGRETRIYLQAWLWDVSRVAYNGFADFLTTQTGNTALLLAYMIKVGGKLGGVTPAPWVLPLTDAKDDGFKW